MVLRCVVWFGLVQGKSTPLHWAAMEGHSDSVQLLLAADSNPNVESYVSSPPAADVMHLCLAELCRGLMQDKATPLHWAAYNGHSESVQLLLTAKSNVNSENEVSHSLLQI